MKDFFKNYVYPIATLAGSIIGVGFLSLPYIALQVGIWPMFFYFIALTALVICIHVIFGQISLKTPDFKRFPGFVGFYLGKWAERLTLSLTILSSFGLFVIYFIVGDQFLTAIASPFFGGNAIFVVFLYFIFGITLIYFGVSIISKIEFWALVLLLATFFVIYVNAFPHILLENIFPVHAPIPSWKTLFLPYGVIIFSLWGIGLIPEIEEMLVGRKQLLKKNIIISILIPAAIYLLFIFLILGITGNQTTQIALNGLKGFLSPDIFLIAMSIGSVTIFTAFITQGLYLKKTLIYDMGMKQVLAWAITCFVPLLLFLAGLNSFISLMSLIGGIVLGINGILVLMMYQKIGGRKIIVYPLILIFILGILYSIIYFVK